MKPEKIVHALFIALCLGLLSLPAANMVAVIARGQPLFVEAPLAGVEVSAERPALTLRGVMDEKFQAAFTTWFTQHYGARGTATRIDNSLAYYAFGEAPPDKHVRVGKDKVLFLDEQMWFPSRQDEVDATGYAKNLKRAQELMRARGKVLLFLLLPTKTNVYPRAWPREWAYPLPEPLHANTRVIEPIAQALRAEGVLWVDGRAVLAPMIKESLPAVYPTTGRHLGAPAACVVLEEGLRLVRPLLPEYEIPTLDCAFTLETKDDFEPGAEENDLLRLLNVWTPHPRVVVPVTKPLPERVPVERRPPTLVVGTSFGWRVVFEGERNHAFRHIRLHYYSKLIVDRDADKTTPLAIATPGWRELIESSSLIIIPAVEEYMPADGAELVKHLLETYGP